MNQKLKDIRYCHEHLIKWSCPEKINLERTAFDFNRESYGVLEKKRLEDERMLKWIK